MSQSSVKEKAFRYATGIFVLIAFVSLISGLICLEDDQFEYGIVLVASFLVLLPIAIWTYYHPFYPVLLGLIVYLFLVGVLIYSPINDGLKYNFDGPLKYLIIGLGVIVFALYVGYKEWRLSGNSKVNVNGSTPVKENGLKNMLRSNQKRSEVALYLVGVVMVVEVVSLVLDFFQYDLLISITRGEVVTEDVANLNDTSQRIVAILFLIVYAISAFTFIQWFRRAYFNLHLKVKTLVHDEGWASGCWFVPVVCLYRPFQIMKELFQKTEKILYSSDDGFKKTVNFRLLNWWWGFWLFSNFFGQFAFRYSNYAETLDELINSTIASMIGSLIGIPLAIITIVIIKKYAKMEFALEKLEEEERKLNEVNS